jgi:hypothetical protein
MAEEAIEIKNQEVFDHLGKFEGPIPGQSLTSNPDEPQSWEQPPEHVTLNSALNGLFEFMTEEDTYISIVTALGDGMPITGMTQMILEDGFQKGSWNPDLMLQLVEPTMYMIMSMAEKAGVKYRVDEEDNPEAEDASEEEVAGMFTDLADIAEGRMKDTTKEEVLPEEIIERLETIAVPESLLAKPETEEPIETDSLLARG